MVAEPCLQCLRRLSPGWDEGGLPQLRGLSFVLKQKWTWSPSEIRKKNDETWTCPSLKWVQSKTIHPNLWKSGNLCQNEGFTKRARKTTPTLVKSYYFVAPQHGKDDHTVCGTGCHIHREGGPICQSFWTTACCNSKSPPTLLELGSNKVFVPSLPCRSQDSTKGYKQQVCFLDVHDFPRMRTNDKQSEFGIPDFETQVCWAGLIQQNNSEKGGRQ